MPDLHVWEQEDVSDSIPSKTFWPKSITTLFKEPFSFKRTENHCLESPICLSVRMDMPRGLRLTFDLGIYTRLVGNKSRREFFARDCRNFHLSFGEGSVLLSISGDFRPALL